MLEMRHVTKIFNPGTVDEKIALNDLSFTLNDGDFVTVIGGNGAGKSTMQNAICGTWLPDAGEILLDGIDLSSLSEHQRAKYLGRVYQDPMTGTAAGMQIEENLALAARRGLRRTLPAAAPRTGAGAGHPSFGQGRHPLRRPAAGADAADGHPP